jgi:hypothetical protein
MPVAISDVVLEGVYAVPNGREHIVREIVSGKVYFEFRVLSSADEWQAGHSLEEAPTIENFAFDCLHLISVPARYSRHDIV